MAHMSCLFLQILWIDKEIKLKDFEGECKEDQEETTTETTTTTTTTTTTMSTIATTITTTTTTTTMTTSEDIISKSFQSGLPLVIDQTGFLPNRTKLNRTFDVAILIY